MNIHVKTALTLSTLAVLVLLGVTWGWAAMTTPFPHRTAAPLCSQTTVHSGDRVAPPQVTVSVFNASQRTGLAGATLAGFQAQGFGAGNVGNAPKGTHVAYAQVWTQDPTNPAVRLVKSRLGPKAHVVRKTHHGPGVVVMVGVGFNNVLRGLPSVKVTKTATICTPPTA